MTIPQDIRERLGLLPQTEVEFEIDGDAVRIRPARRGTSRGDALDRPDARHRRPRAHHRSIMALTRRYTMATLVDSNVILDVVTDDAEWGDWSASMLTQAAQGAGSDQSADLRRSRLRVHADRGSDGAAAGVFHARTAALARRLSGIAGVSRLPSAWRRPHDAAAGFLHRCPRRHSGLHAADAGSPAVQDVLPQAASHRAVGRGSAVAGPPGRTADHGRATTGPSHSDNGAVLHHERRPVPSP